MRKCKGKEAEAPALLPGCESLWGLRRAQARWRRVAGGNQLKAAHATPRHATPRAPAPRLFRVPGPEKAAAGARFWAGTCGKQQTPTDAMRHAFMHSYMIHSPTSQPPAAVHQPSK